jgi:energy-coupling factor transporter transmembrane protein EcfT
MPSRPHCDPRVKLVGLAALSIAATATGPVGLALLSAAGIAGAACAGLSLWQVLTRFKAVGVLLLGVLIARALTTPGEAVLTVWRLSVTEEGLITGALIVWRLAVVILLGVAFVAATPVGEVKAAVQWFLKPVPGVPEKRVGTMFALLVRFLPRILHTAHETMAAQRARGIENRKNPVYRLTRLTFPLVRRTFQDADRLVLAMTARCYSDRRTDPQLCGSRTDLLILAFCMLFCAVLVLLG